MARSVDVGARSVADYRGVARDGLLEALAVAAEPLRGARVLHLNATPYGGGVAELLHSLVPLLNDLGLVTEWKVISADDSFFRVTKAIHNALQGADVTLSVEDHSAYEQACARNAAVLTEDYDFAVVHDPQPAAVLPLRGRGDARWIWRCHIDTSTPNPEAWAFVREFLADYDAGVFTLSDYVQPDLPLQHVEVIPPAIDPLSTKNCDLSDERTRELVRSLGIRTDRPLITQISRFDPWKDPSGVIAAYRLAREVVGGLQLALAGSMASDDPEGSGIHREIESASQADPDIHVLTNLSDLEVNALQRLSDVCIQKSIREGFGLVVSEAMWKRTPVVAGCVGGIPLQMADGTGGFLVEDVASCGEAIIALVGDQERARELGSNGHERVREHFLLPRLLLNELSLLKAVAVPRPAVVAAEEQWRDPVCGIAISRDTGAYALMDGRRTLRFCSEDCRSRFSPR